MGVWIGEFRKLAFGSVETAAASGAGFVGRNSVSAFLSPCFPNRYAEVTPARDFLCKFLHRLE